MLDQEKIGKYIAEKRKGLGLTQKQLADKVGLTDKAVSKWERAKSLPDNDVIPSLCEALHITVNEFLSGEDIIKEEYSEKAEENMMSLVADNKKQTKDSKLIIVSLCIGFLCLLLGTYSVMLNMYKLKQMIYLIDVPSLLLVIGITTVVSIVAGTIKNFVRIPWIMQGRNLNDNKEIHKALQSVKVVMLSNLLGGLLCAIGQLVMVVPRIQEMSNVFAALSISMLPLLYAVFIDLILIPVYFRLVNLEEYKQ